MQWEREDVHMNTVSMDSGTLDMAAGPQKETEMAAEAERETEYEYAGYKIRIHFAGDRTFVQCLKNLAQKRISA